MVRATVSGNSPQLHVVSTEILKPHPDFVNSSKCMPGDLIIARLSYDVRPEQGLTWGVTQYLAYQALPIGVLPVAISADTRAVHQENQEHGRSYGGRQ